MSMMLKWVFFGRSLIVAVFVDAAVIARARVRDAAALYVVRAAAMMD